MYREISVILLIGLLNYSAGYKWITLKPGDPIPENAVLISEDLDTYVGRTRHFNELLPAEVHNSTHGFVYSCSNVIPKYEFEILVKTEYCVYKWTDLKNIPENIVRGGTEQNNEPTYIGLSRDNKFYRVASISLTNNRITLWEDANDESYALVCDHNFKWVDTAANKIPENAVSGGQSADGQNMFVARLKEGCDIIPGQVIPELGIAIADYKGKNITSSFCQVLVQNPDEYIWVLAKDGEIPYNAVVAGKMKPRTNGNCNNHVDCICDPFEEEDCDHVDYEPMRGTYEELIYVVRVNKKLGYLVYSEARDRQTPYEILVKNVK